MPVVELSYSRLQELVGATKEQISESLPFLGLDIESEDGDLVRVEYSPNRPDYSTDYGISLGLQGFLGIKTGPVGIKIKKSGRYAIEAKPGVKKTRPYITGIVARGGSIDNMLIRQLVAMQEDLHVGIGRRRKKSSIGIHDLDKISFPLTYTTINQGHRFVPLNSDAEIAMSQILADTEVGRKYGRILGGHRKMPVLLDADGSTVSFPPITNAARTALTESTRELFVEVTGTGKGIEDVLAVVVLALQAADFVLEEVKITGSGNSTPKMQPRQIRLDPGLVNRTLGLELSTAKIISSLKKSRLGATRDDTTILCMVPAYRFDILGPMDLVEEAALGYGINNLVPSLPPSETIGGVSPESAKLKRLGILMVGLGYTEALNSSLTSRKTLYEMTGRKNAQAISVLDPKSQAHTVLRDSILPELVENLSRNIHAPYPQRLFETGTVFVAGMPVSETASLACISAHKNASFSEAKSVLQSVLGTGFGINTKTKTSLHPMFEEGRTAQIMVGRKVVGVIGEINSTTLAGHKIRMPVAGFEISLSGLIFDLPHHKAPKSKHADGLG